MKAKRDSVFISDPPWQTEAGDFRPEISLSGTETNGVPDDQVIMCGYVPVQLQKMFGPLIFADIRIRASAETCEWIIEREDTIYDSNGNSQSSWKEIIRIPGQLESDFPKDT